ncbi:MAG: hypothetical protein LUD00_09690, partial [Prevotellaceae bacterium]|nr:hypothetical protein [Prevotellaceae bacterium]
MLPKFVRNKRCLVGGRQTPHVLCGCFVGVFDRLLRRYRATSPNLGEEPSYRIGCQCYTHKLP